MVRKSDKAATCADAASLEHAEQSCRAQGITFTPIRRDVYGLLCGHRRPVGAYELLDELKESRPRAAPVTVYRALEFLLEAGLAHKIHTLNAFMACRGSEQSHRGLMLICSHCSNVIELEDRKVDSSIARSAADLEFETSDKLVEVLGTCAECRR